MMLADVVRQNATKKPDEFAFIIGGVQREAHLTWRQYDLYSSQLALRLSGLGIQRQDVIAVLLPDSPATHIVYLACEKAGLIPLGLSPRVGNVEFNHLLQHAEAKVLVTQRVVGGIDIEQRIASLYPSELLSLLLEPGLFEASCGLLGISELDSRRRLFSVEASEKHVGAEDIGLDALDRLLNPDEVFLLNTTSGTTGLPKCVVQNQSRWFYFHQLVVAAAEVNESDVFMSLLPTPVGFGLWTAHFSPAILSVPTVIPFKFEVEAVLDAIERQRVTVLAAVSTQFIMLLNSPTFAQRDFSSLRILYTGGERVPTLKAQKFEAITGAKVLQFYGSNETGAVSCTTIYDTQEQRLQTAGRPVIDMQVRLIDGAANDVTEQGYGQPVCDGPAVSLGYYRDDEANANLRLPDGAMKTGDLAILDASGYLTVCGRAGDFIIRGGKNISAAAVEEAALLHPQIEHAAAIAVKDDVFGERVCLFVVLKAAKSLTLTDLTRFMRESGCSKENLPEQLQLLDSMPLSSGGKTAKAELKALLA